MPQYPMNATPRGRVVVTCGPSFEPIDEVRRITNHSTGMLGWLLSNRLARDGWEVSCLKGIGATHHGSIEPGVDVTHFGTNDDLQARLTELPERERIAAVFHAVALCDFKVKHILAGETGLGQSAKISSRGG